MTKYCCCLTMQKSTVSEQCATVWQGSKRVLRHRIERLSVPHAGVNRANAVRRSLMSRRKLTRRNTTSPNAGGHDIVVGKEVQDVLPLVQADLWSVPRIVPSANGAKVSITTCVRRGNVTRLPARRSLFTQRWTGWSVRHCPRDFFMMIRT